jgi:hypothetical protein
MTPDHPEHARNLPPEVLAARKAKRLEEAEKLLDVIVTAAMDEEQPMTLRVNAAIAGRTQIVGAPMTRNLNYEAASADELRDEPTDRERAKALALLVQKQKASGE